jgi:hypothetical protein
MKRNMLKNKVMLWRGALSSKLITGCLLHVHREGFEDASGQAEEAVKIGFRDVQTSCLIQRPISTTSCLAPCNEGIVLREKEIFILGGRYKRSKLLTHADLEL